MALMVIYIRQRNEYHIGHITAALNIELGELQEHLDGRLRELPVVTVCAAGIEGTTDGSILQRDGRDTSMWLTKRTPKPESSAAIRSKQNNSSANFDLATKKRPVLSGSLFLCLI